eukprot:7016522-Pyramimonas_sp.AAC.3
MESAMESAWTHQRKAPHSVHLRRWGCLSHRAPTRLPSNTPVSVKVSSNRVYVTAVSVSSNSVYVTAVSVVKQ